MSLDLMTLVRRRRQWNSVGAEPSCLNEVSMFTVPAPTEYEAVKPFKGRDIR